MKLDTRIGINVTPRPEPIVGAKPTGTLGKPSLFRNNPSPTPNYGAVTDLTQTTSAAPAVRANADRRGGVNANAPVSIEMMPTPPSSGRVLQDKEANPSQRLLDGPDRGYGAGSSELKSALKPSGRVVTQPRQGAASSTAVHNLNSGAAAVAVSKPINVRDSVRYFVCSASGIDLIAPEKRSILKESSAKPQPEITPAYGDIVRISLPESSIILTAGRIVWLHLPSAKEVAAVFNNWDKTSSESEFTIIHKDQYNKDYVYAEINIINYKDITDPLKQPIPITLPNSVLRARVKELTNASQLKSSEEFYNSGYEVRPKFWLGKFYTRQQIADEFEANSEEAVVYVDMPATTQQRPAVVIDNATKTPFKNFLDSVRKFMAKLQ